MKRYFAMMIDISIILVYAALLALITIFFIEDYANLNEVTSNIVGVVFMIVPACGYFLVSEYKWNKTIGKRILGLEVVFESKSIKALLTRTTLFALPWVFGHAFVFRGVYSMWQGSLLIFLGIMTYGVLILNFCLMLGNKKHQGFHELLSKSYVIKVAQK